MRQLRLVGLAEDGASVVLATPGGDEYRLPVDERLRAACRGDLTRLGQIEIEMENPLRPREIQARVRAGESPEELAADSGMPVERVLRFAYPVLQERERVVAQARAIPLRPKDPAPLGQLVEERLVSRGTDPATLRWDAWRREDGRWAVRLRWRHAAEHSAVWTLQLAGRIVRPDDPAAEQLSGEDFGNRTITAVTPLAAATPVATRRPAPPAPPATGATPAPPATRPTPAPSAARPTSSRPAVRPTLERPTSEEPTSERPTSEEPTSEEPTSERPTSEEPGPQKPARERPASGRPAKASAPADRGAARPRSEGEGPDREAARKVSGGEALEVSDEERARKASVPSWDDILLGVRRRH